MNRITQASTAATIMSGLAKWMALASLALVACSRRSAGPAPTFVGDAWVRPEPTAHSGSMVEIESSAIREVVANLQPEAQAMLAAQAFSVLDAAAVERYVGGGSFARGTGIPVLVRAVGLLPDESSLHESDRFLVRWGGGDLVVTSLASRRDETAQVRKALVVMLPEEPDEVFVECLVARHGLPDK